MMTTASSLIFLRERLVQPVFQRILNFFFFSKIECGLYFLDRFDMLISKMIFKK